MAAGIPCALVTSCSSTFTGDRLVQHILGTEDLLIEATSNDTVRFYPWTIDNKYYSADINLCVVPNKFLVTAEIAESVQAFVVYFDSTQKSGLDTVSSWLPLAEAWLPEVMILVCDRVSEDGVNRQKAQEWCIKHGFELVELSPEELPEEDDPMLDLDIQELASLTTGGGDLENFERLFSKLKEMKGLEDTIMKPQKWQLRAKNEVGCLPSPWTTMSVHNMHRTT
ncbi:Alpha- and gamma-adaptin-binding protein p34 [Sciurus carolinensis]|uniref:Alpha- and gamma-adaptin-binding protein p34 n=1 Tax=Sciurus carolinensis TaxID=30640 RepID=A0AA41NIR9_SCICA|nr:Alpha- and gamma-adaptin-binding protein p34 [Sciurus carolinensis]